MGNAAIESLDRCNRKRRQSSRISKPDANNNNCITKIPASWNSTQHPTSDIPAVGLATSPAFGTPLVLLIGFRLTTRSRVLTSNPFTP